MGLRALAMGWLLPTVPCKRYSLESNCLQGKPHPFSNPPEFNSLSRRRQVKITATDELGEGGAPLMTPDQVPVTLHAGPPAQLSVEGPATLEVGTKAAIPQLRVRVCDATGNPTSSETFEVGGVGEAGPGWGVGRRCWAGLSRAF